MITVEVDGVRVECDDEKAARKVVREAARKAKAAQIERERCYGIARAKAESAAYRLMWQKAKNGGLARAHRLYREGENRYAGGLIRSLPCDFGYGWRHALSVADESCGCWATFEHYGNTLVGAVCNGAGYVSAIVLRDDSTREETVFAVASEGGHVALADIPGFTAADFHTRENAD